MLMFDNYFEKQNKCQLRKQLRHVRNKKKETFNPAVIFYTYP